VSRAYSQSKPQIGIGIPSTSERPSTNNSRSVKTTVSVWLRYDNWEDRGIIEEFCKVFPFGKKGIGFSLESVPDDPRLKQVLDEFARRGIPRVDYSKNPRPRFEYMLEYHHHYEAADFDSARYLYLQHEVLISDDQRRDEQGHLLLPSARLSPNLQIGCVLFDVTVVSDALRREMIQAGLVGPRFVEVVPEGQTAGPQFWELKGSIILPPMPRDRVLRHKESPEDDVHVAGILDGDYLEKEIHYTEDALRKIEPFDVAETYEIFCGPGWKKDGNGERRLVASQRFRQFCLERHLKVSWHSPVRIDPPAQGSTR
jgi:hypothetical protein